MKNSVIRGFITLSAIVLTAKLGTIQFGDHKETFYNLPMGKIVERADAYYGMSDVYEVREDGVKTYNGMVIVAAHKSVPYGTLLETSRGTGIVLDYHTTGNENLYDLATDWGKGGKE